MTSIADDESAAVIEHGFVKGEWVGVVVGDDLLSENPSSVDFQGAVATFLLSAHDPVDLDDMEAFLVQSHHDASAGIGIVSQPPEVFSSALPKFIHMTSSFQVGLRP